MNTTYTKEVLSPFQPRNKVLPTEINVRQINYKLPDLIKKLCKSYRLEAQFAEDEQMKNELPDIAGLICIKCRLLNEKSEVIAIGRSCSVFTKSTFVERSIRNCLNGSFLSSCNNLTKLIETLQSYDEDWSNRSIQQEDMSDRPTEKQIALLKDLIAERPLSQVTTQDIDRMTRSEASSLIGELLNR